MLFWLPVQNFTEIGQLAAELSPKTIFRIVLSMKSTSETTVYTEHRQCHV